MNGAGAVENLAAPNHVTALVWVFRQICSGDHKYAIIF
jgi:hypothetical protein